jgi:hypothetical protein
VFEIEREKNVSLSFIKSEQLHIECPLINSGENGVRS